MGTLEPATDADLVVWDGEPFAFDTRSRHVFVDGEHVFDRERDQVDPYEEWEW